MGQEEVHAVRDQVGETTADTITLADPLGWQTALNLAGRAHSRGLTADLRPVLQALGLVAADPQETWACGHPKTAVNTYVNPDGLDYCLRCKSAPRGTHGGWTRRPARRGSVS